MAVQGRTANQEQLSCHEFDLKKNKNRNARSSPFLEDFLRLLKLRKSDK